MINLNYAIYRKMINLGYATYQKIDKQSGPKVSSCPRVPILLSLEALISGKGCQENLGKMSDKRDNKRVGFFEGEYQSLPSSTKILLMPQFSYMPDQILRKQNGKTQFSSQNLTFL